MPLIYITGVSGTGKSTILNELRSRGYTAFGVDEDGYGKWTHRKTGLAVQPGRDFDVHDWYRDHHYSLDVSKVIELQQRTKRQDGLVFLCGSAPDENKTWQLFDVSIGLVIDSDTLKQRIVERTTNEFGKDPTELEHILLWHKAHGRSYYANLGVPCVDASQPLPDVMDAIFVIINNSPAIASHDTNDRK
jgi:uridine kinase